MDDDDRQTLARIAAALDRLAPAKAPAPDFGLALDLLVGVERQKLRFAENLTRFAAGLPANHVLLWGVRGTGKSSLAQAAFMAVAGEHSAMRMVEIDRDEVAA